MPSMSGSTRSSSTTSGRHARNSSTARDPTRAARTSYPGSLPPCSITIFNQSVTIDSSSTTRTRRRVAGFIDDISAGQSRRAGVEQHTAGLRPPFNEEAELHSARVGSDPSDRAAALDHADQHDRNGDHQQDVDESA